MVIDVVTIGSAVLDVLLKSEHFTVAPVGKELMVCEIYGGKMDVDEAMIASGGAATNTAVSFARQGFVVACVVEVGVDVPAQIIWDDIHREGVHTRYMVVQKDEHTGISSILVSKDGSRSAMTFRGAARQLHVHDVRLDLFDNVRAIHLSSVGDLDLIRKVSEHCLSHHIFFSWNPSKGEAEEFFLRQAPPKGVFCDALFVNDIEWEAIERKRTTVEQSAKMLVITRGRKGGEVIRGGVSTPYTAKVVAVVDETGAGDAFASGFIGAHLRGESLEAALTFAVDNASSVVGYMGAKAGLLRIT